MLGFLNIKTFPILIVIGLAGGLAIAFAFLNTYQRGYKSGYDKGTLVIQQQWDREKALINESTANAIAEAVRKSQEAYLKEKEELIKKNQAAIQASQEIINQANKEARAWRLRYQEALKEPICQKWAEETIPCPIN